MFIKIHRQICIISVILSIVTVQCVPSSVLLAEKEKTPSSKTIRKTLSEIKNKSEGSIKQNSNAIIQKRGVNPYDADSFENIPKGQWDSLPVYLFANNLDDTIEQFPNDNAQLMQVEYPYRIYDDRRKRAITKSVRGLRLKRELKHTPSEIVALLELLRENDLKNSNPYSRKMESTFNGFARMNEYPNSLLASSDKFNSVKDDQSGSWGPPVDASKFAELPYDMSFSDLSPVYESYKNRGSKRFMVAKKKRSLTEQNLKNIYQKASI